MMVELTAEVRESSSSIAGGGRTPSIHRWIGIGWQDHNPPGGDQKVENPALRSFVSGEHGAGFVQ